MSESEGKNITMTANMYRQGNLLFTAIPALPGGLTPRSGNIIVEGEATGHAHRLLAGRVLEDTSGTLFLEVLGATQIIHPEHHALNLSPGLYRVTRQREYTPEPEIIREVRD